MGNKVSDKRVSAIGIIPQYPKHSQYNIYGGVIMPPVGIISVLSQITDNPSLKTIYAIDENNYRGPEDLTGMPDHKFLQDREAAKIAFFYGGMSNSIPRMFSLAKQYQGFGAVTIAGGGHVDALPEEALHSGVDIVVHGEGEITTKKILESIIADGDVQLDRHKLSEIKGISLLDDSGKYVSAGKRDPITDLDELKDPDLTLIKFLRKRWTAIPISRGRGCNYSCEFCTVNNLYGQYKSSSIDKTVRQIEKYSDMGYKNFFITDDNFAQRPAETIELCERIGKDRRKFFKKLNFTVQVRSEVAENNKLIAAMKSAGVNMLAIGFESPIDEELKAMNKGVTVKDLARRSRKLADYFYIHGMFIFGYPTFADSEHKSDLSLEEKAKRYVKFFRDARLDTIQVVNAVPLPGSDLRKKLEAEGRVLPKEMVGWEWYDGLSALCYAPEKGVDPYDLQNLPKVLMKKKYLGNWVGRNINYGNWMHWAFNATIGFPIQFGVYYTKRFFHNLSEQRKGESIIEDPQENIFKRSLTYSLGDIKRDWRNLLIKTWGGNIVRKWYRESRKNGNAERSKELYSGRQNKTANS
jgi:radical SAM superfamily enzyme YgiQ (UPF0313 family)